MTLSSQPRLVRDTPFGRFLIARTLVQIGGGISYIALPVLAYRISGSPSAPALVTACETAPYILFGPIAGALGDRWDRRRVMVATDLLGALAVFGLFAAHHFATLTLFQVVATALVMASLQVTFDGAAFGAVPSLVGRARVGEANSRMWSAMSTVDVALPAFTGTLLAFVHPADLVSINTLTYLSSAWLISGLVTLSRDVQPVSRLSVGVLRSEVMEGFTFLIRHPGIRVLTLISFLQCFALGGMLALLVPLADQRLGIGTSGPRFGGLYAAYGIGGLCASLLLPRLLATASAQRIATRTLPLLTVAQMGTIFASHWLLASLFIMLWSGGWTLTMLTAVTYRQQETPDRLQGRVNTVGRMLAAGLGTTGGTLAGAGFVGVVGITSTLAITCSIGALSIPIAMRGHLDELPSELRQT